MKKALLVLLWLAPIAPAQFYNISPIAGFGRLPFGSNGGVATNARLIQPAGVATDPFGNTYISDTYYEQVFRISANGTITVYAGNGQEGSAGDGGPATAAQLSNPQGLAVDSSGNLFICDYSNSRVRKVSLSGTISTAAIIGSPYGVAVDAAGNLYVSQSAQQTVSMVTPSGQITKIAGTGSPGFSGDGGPALSAMLYTPQGLKLDKAGNLLVTDSYNHRIRKITPQGTITTFAGNGTGAFKGDGSQATAASLFYPTDVVIDANGNVYIADATNERIRMVTPNGVISTVAGGGASATTSSALQAQLAVPTAIAIDSQGNVVFPLGYLRLVRALTPQRSLITIAGALPTAGSGDNVLATSSVLIDPVGIASDSAGNIFIADQGDNRIRKVSTAGIITTAGGTGLFGSTGNNGLAVNAEIGSPRGVGLDPAGDLYVISPIGAVVRKIAPGGLITAFAGGSIGSGGDGGPATSAQLNLPANTIGDSQGNVYISDDATARIRKVDSAGIITTYAGTGSPGYSGDNGPAISAQLYRPKQLALDAKGNLYVADQGNNRIRKIALNGTITTVAGNGVAAFAGDGGPATAAQIGAPTGLAIDPDGNLFISTAGARIRKVAASTGTISTIAGTGTGGFSGDGGLATLAMLGLPIDLAADGAGNIYVVDEGNQRIRKLTPAQIVREGVTNGATFKTGGVAPGEIVSIFGAGVSLGPTTGAQIDASGRLTTELGGTQALFDGVPAPLIFVSSGQVNAVVPYEVAGKSSTQLQLMIQGKPTNAATLPVVASSPGIFAITNQDGTVNAPSTPSPAGGILVLYATGEGLVSPTVADGTINTTVFPAPLLKVSVKIAGQDGAIKYAGAAPYLVAGVLQVNVEIPAGVTGTVPLQLQIGDAVTPAGLMVSVSGQ